MFAIPIFGLKSLGISIPAWLKLMSTFGLLMTLLYVALSVVPIINVENRLLFALKIGGLIVIMNAVGLLILLFARRKRPR